MKDRLIIFDMDGTLYDLNDVLSMAYDMQVAYLSVIMKKDTDTIVKLLSDNNIYPSITKESKSATEFFLKNGIDKKDWSNYREAHFDVSKISLHKAVKAGELRKYKQFGKLVLLSSNSYRTIIKVLEHICIPVDIFDDIISSDNFKTNNTFNKKEVMLHLSEKYEIPHSKMLSIGDRYKTDIEPILQIGGQGILLSRPEGIYTLLSDLENNCLHSNIDYDFFTNQN